jgi:hypothetical protein
MKRRPIKNDGEEQCAQELERKGYKPSKRGWPDFIAFCRTGGRPPIAVEAKPDRQHLRREQAAVMEILSRAGIACYRWDPVDGLQPWCPVRQAARVDLSKRRAKEIREAWKAERRAKRLAAQKQSALAHEEHRRKKAAKRRAVWLSKHMPLRESVDAPLWRLGS